MTPPFVAANWLAEAGTTAAGPTPTPHPISNSDFLRAVYGSLAVYPELSAAKLGMVGSLTARQEAHTVRLALLYALLEASEKIEPRHLSAALAVTEYSRASVEYIYGDTLGDAVADTILSSLKAAGAGGLTRTEISNIFSRNCSRYQIDRALKDLAHFGRAKVSRDDATGGRPGEVWFATGT